MAEPKQPSSSSYYQDVRAHHLEPLWTIPDWFLGSEPLRSFRPHQWHWSEVGPRLLEAERHMVPGEGGSRRVLVLAHPDLKETLGTTRTLNAAFQMILPGERAPAHRHTPLAIRFIISGSGAWTTVNGERMSMQAGDFLLTPRWGWHDHGHDGDEPMIWLDGLDIPLSRYFDAIFVEPSGQAVQELSVVENQSSKLYGIAGVFPKSAVAVANQGLMAYPWTLTREALVRARETAPNPHDGAIVEFRNPTTAGPVMPTLSATMQSLLPGEVTSSHRHTSSSIYYVFKGHGATKIDGQWHPWDAGDVLALPPWRVHAHANRSADAEALLFAISDEPVLRALGLFREEDEVRS